MSELKVLFPEVEVEIKGGEVVKIRPIPFGQLAKASGLITRIFGSALSGYAEMQRDPSAAALIIGQALMSGGDDIYELLSIGLKKDRAWFDSIDMEDGLKLTATFLEVNADFFVQKALPVIQGSVAKMKKTASAA